MSARPKSLWRSRTKILGNGTLIDAGREGRKLMIQKASVVMTILYVVMDGSHQAATYLVPYSRIRMYAWGDGDPLVSP
jgi:hypothetical protein